MNTPKKYTTIAAAILNDYHQILPYTVKSTAQQVEEYTIEFLGKELWDKMKEIGCRIVQVEITAIDTALYPLPGGQFDETKSS